MSTHGVAAVPAPEQWRPMETAPTDGTMVRLLVDYRGEDACHPLEDAEVTHTIGGNTDGHTGLSEGWKFAGWSWEQDCFTEGRGKALGWLPLAPPGVPPCPNASMSGGCPCGYADCTKRPRGVPAAAPISYTHEPAQDAMLDKFAAAGFKYDGNGGWQADLSTTELLALGAALGVPGTLKPWEIPGPNQPNPPLPRDLDPTVQLSEGNSTGGVALPPGAQE